MTAKPTVAVDNSVLNRIAKDNDTETVIAAMASGFELRIPAMAFEEAIGTPKLELRTKLMDTCRRLVASGSCINAAHLLLDRHVKRFHDYPHRYDWRNVQSRVFDFEEEMLSGRLYTDEALVAAQAAEMAHLQAEFETGFPKSKRTTGHPNIFADWLAECRVKGGSFWSTARGLYGASFRAEHGLMIGRPLLNPPDDAVLETFLNLCPPMRASVYAFELTHYDRSLRTRLAMSYKAGRNDQMMAVYLPYCDQFLTNDKAQHRCLTEVARSAGIPTQVLFYDEFRSSLPI